jgi:signal transduction histidine kinase
MKIKASDKIEVSRELLEKYAASIVKLEEQIDYLKDRETALNKLTSSLEKRNLRLEELNQIKDEFIGIASHQLRTPATGVKQYINLLLDGFAEGLAPGQRVFLEKAQESNDRQLRIIDDLLQVARIDSESFRLSKLETDLTQIIEITIQEFSHKASLHKQKIILSLPKKRVIVRVDREKIKMVLENILDNAINYSADNKIIRVGLTSSAKWVKISFIDEGVGIAKQDFAKLFQKFSRIPNPLSVEVGGTGLGLYWAKKVADLHGGDIAVSSKIGQGSSFTVSIPYK